MNTVTRTCTLRTLCIRSNFNLVTMPTCDVLLRHFGKTMLYTESIRVAYSYLLYTLGRRYVELGANWDLKYVFSE